MAALEQRWRYFAEPQRSRSWRFAPSGMRVTAKRVNGVSVKGWIYRNGLVPFAETDTNGVVSSWFVYGTNPFSPDYMVKDGVTYRFVRDFMGSVRLVVNATTGDIVQRLDYFILLLS